MASKHKKFSDAFKYHTGLKHVNFKDITRENILKMKDSVRSKGMQGDTHNNYLRHIRALYNKALANNTTYRDFKFSKDLFEKTDKHSKKLLTNQPHDIALAIESLILRSSDKRAIGYTMRDFEAIGLATKILTKGYVWQGYRLSIL